MIARSQMKLKTARLAAQKTSKRAQSKSTRPIEVSIARMKNHIRLGIAKLVEKSQHPFPL